MLIELVYGFEDNGLWFVRSVIPVYGFGSNLGIGIVSGYSLTNAMANYKKQVKAMFKLPVKLVLKSELVFNNE